MGEKRLITEEDKLGAKKRANKKWYEANKERARQYQAKYRVSNMEVVQKYQAQYYTENKEIIRRKQAEYRAKIIVVKEPKINVVKEPKIRVVLTEQSLYDSKVLKMKLYNYPIRDHKVKYQYKDNSYKLIN